MIDIECIARSIDVRKFGKIIPYCNYAQICRFKAKFGLSRGVGLQNISVILPYIYRV